MSEDTTEVSVEALQAELETVRKALKTANAEAKKYRETSEALVGRVSELESDDGTKVWKDKALKAEVKTALREQGVKNPERVLKVLDLEGVDLDDSGKVTGLDAKVVAAKAEWPELWDLKRQVGGAADAFATGEVKQKMTGTEVQAARLFNRT